MIYETVALNGGACDGTPIGLQNRPASPPRQVARIPRDTVLEYLQANGLDPDKFTSYLDAPER